MQDDRTSKLSSLSRVVRKEDGLTYYCFPEVKAKLFPGIPQGTVKTWIRSSKVFKSKCTPQEHAYFKNRIPNIAHGAFKLISQEALLKLLDLFYLRGTVDQSPQKKQKVMDVQDKQKENSQKVVENSKSQNCISEKSSSQATFLTNNSAPLDVSVNLPDGNDSCSSSSEVSSTSSDEENPPSCPTRKFLFKSRNSRKLDLDQLGQDTLFDLEALKSFYSRPLNPKRHGNACKPVTIEKLEERVLVYFKFLRSVKGYSFPELKHMENADLVQEFCEYLLSDERKLKSLTVSRYLCSFIKVFQYLHKEESVFEQEKSSCLSKFRALQKQLEFDARREEKKSIPNRTGINYEDILMVARKILHDFEDLSNSIDKARTLMNFCVMLLYVHLTGRCKEFVSLRIIDSERLAETIEGNFLVNQPDSKLVLLCREYKTSKVYGTDRTELDEPNLEYYIRLYIDRFRTKLLQGNSHDYFLVNHHGGPFSTSSFNKYVGNIFEKYCDFRVGINDMRHSLVTYFLSLSESKDEKLSESLAAVMKHTVRTQRRFYDKRTLAQKKEPALRFLAQTARSGIFDDDDNDMNVSSKEIDKEGFSDEVLPVIGDFVALVARNSTRRSPQIFIAKVLRFSDNKKDVLLAHMEEIEENNFKLTIGKSYLESTNSLIFPIDIAYKTSDRVYELRSQKLDLHNQICP